MPRQLRFHQLDVFTSKALKGNPLAVVHEAEVLSEQEMAAFARWTNLSETTFLLPPTTHDADYRLRIFTPGGELPFAGHPTLGTCQAWLLAGGKPQSPDQIVQECGVGLVRIRKQGVRLAFAAPPLRKTGPLEPDIHLRIAQGLGVTKEQILHHQWVDNGPGWCAVMLESAALVLSLKPDFVRLGDLKLGVIAPHLPSHDADFEVRAFVASLGVKEDPVTGASMPDWPNGSLGLGWPRPPISRLRARPCRGKVAFSSIRSQTISGWVVRSHPVSKAL